MKTTKFFGALLLAGLIVAGLGVVLPVSTVTSSVETKSFDPVSLEIKTAILDATIQIVQIVPSQNQGKRVYVHGLGTLVRSQGEYLIYTHDHWGDFEDCIKVEFRNAQGELLFEMSGDQVKSLVRHQDGGNLLLKAPVEVQSDYLAALINLSDPQFQRPLEAAEMTMSVVPDVGDQLVATRRDPDDRHRIELLAVYVEAVSEVEGVPVYHLRSQNGQVIIPGDSGGGVWLNGRLVGNVWWTEYVYDRQIWNWDSFQPKRKYLDKSAAAGLPEVLVAQVDTGPLPTVNNNPAGLLGGERED